MEYSNVQEHFALLLNRLKLQPFIDNLFSTGVLHSYDYATLCDKKRMHQNLEFLLNIEIYDAMELFSDWLSTADVALYSTVIEKKVRDVRFTQKTLFSSRIMLRNYSILRTYVNAQVVAPYLYQERILSSDDLQSVMTLPTRCERLNILLPILSRNTGNPDHYTIVQRVIRKFQPSLFNRITKTLVENP